MKRNIFLDNLKAILIMLVILGHCIQWGCGLDYYNNGLYFNNILFKTIYSFHMPLFIGICGYLFYHSVNKRTLTETIKSKFKGTIIPIFSFSIISFLLDVFQGNLTITLKNILPSFLNVFIYNLWFLWTIFFCSVIIAIIKHKFNDNLLIYLTIFLISFIIPDIYLLQYYKFMYPYFLLGYLFNKYKHYLLPKLKTKENIILGVSLMTYILLLIFFNYNSYIYTSGHYILNGHLTKQLLIDIYRYIIGFVGSIVIILLTKKIINNKKIPFMAKIGESTMGIYMISSLIFVYVFPYISSRITTKYFIPIEFLLVLFLSYLLTKLLNKFSFTRKYFLGKS